MFDCCCLPGLILADILLKKGCTAGRPSGVRTRSPFQDAEHA